MKNLFILLLLTLFLPFLVFAQVSNQPFSTVDLQKQIQDLLKQVEALQKQVSTLQAELGKEPETPSASAATPASTAAPDSTPPELTRSLSFGSSGDDVRKLQEFLAKDKEIYPEGLLTGFFGPRTEQAVKKWQEKHGIEGVGTVGPKTIAKFQDIGRGVVRGLLSQGAGQSGVIPPGFILSPGIQKFSTSTLEAPPVLLSPNLFGGTTTLVATTTSPVAPVPTPTIVISTFPTQSASSAGNGACIVWDEHSFGMPNYFAPDVGPGYAKVNKPGVTSFNTSLCSQEEYNILLQKYCDYNRRYGFKSYEAAQMVVNFWGKSGTPYDFSLYGVSKGGALFDSRLPLRTCPAAAPVVVPPDITSPVISFIQYSGHMTGVKEYREYIVFSTDEPASVEVEYGLTSSYSSRFSPVRAVQRYRISHEDAILENLPRGAADLTYHFRIKAKDLAGNLAVSPDMTFVVPAAPEGQAVATIVLSDNIPPSVPTNLTASAISAGTVKLTWNNSHDNVKMHGYKIYRNGTSEANLIATPINSLNDDPPYVTPLDYYDRKLLTPNTTYTYAISAVDEAGKYSAYSNIVTVTTLPFGTGLDTTPPVISNIQAINIASSSATISWDTHEVADSQVEYGLRITGAYENIVPPVPCVIGKDWDGTACIAANFSTSHRFVLLNLSPGTTYYYRVRSRDASGNLTVNVEKTFTTAAAETVPVPAPTPAPAPAPAPTTTSPTTTTTSTATTTTTTATVTTAVPPTPTNPAVRTAYDSVGGWHYNVFSFLDSPHSAYDGSWGNKIYRNGVLLKDHKIYNIEPDFYTYSHYDTNLPSGTTYTYTVATYNPAGTSAQSSPVSITTASQPVVTPTAPDTTVPSVPTNLTASSYADAELSARVSLSWTASTDNVGVSFYTIYVNGVRDVNATSPGYLAYARTSTTYTYTVAANDAAGNVSAQSAPVTVTTPAYSSTVDTTPPSVPTNLTATVASSTQINLSWAASTDNTGVSPWYKIYRNGVLYSSSGLTLLSLTYSDTNLSPSTTYTYTVAAYDAAGNLSAQSNAVTVATLAAADTTAPSVPTGLIATHVSSGSITLQWTASTDNVGVTGYKLYRGVPAYPTPSLLEPSIAGTSINTYYVSPSTTYTFTVAAYDAAGNVSAQSAAVTVTTPASGSTATTTASIGSRAQNLAAILKSLSSVLQKLQEALR